jgi:hypothetical protein
MPPSRTAQADAEISALLAWLKRITRRAAPRPRQKSLRPSTTPGQGPGVQGPRRSPLPMRRDVTRRGFGAVEVGIYNVIHTIAAAVTSLDAGGGGVSGAARVVSRTARSKARLWHDVSWVKV